MIYLLRLIDFSRTGKLLRQKYLAFKELLRHDKRSLELITDLEDLLQGERLVDWARVESLVRALRWSEGRLIDSLLSMNPAAYRVLEERFRQIESSLVRAVALLVRTIRTTRSSTASRFGRVAPAVASTIS